MIDEFLVRFKDVAGIADSDWLKLAPGMSVVTGRNNVGKSRILKATGDLIQALEGLGAFTNVPQVRVVANGRTVEADFRVVPGGQFAQAPSTYLVFNKQGQIEYEIGWIPPEAGGASLEYGAPGGAKSRISFGNLSSRNGIPLFRSMTFLPEHGSVLSAVDRLIYIPPERPFKAEQATNPLIVPKPDASDLPQALYHHIGNATPQAKQLEAVLLEMFPEVKQILASPTSPGQITLRLRDSFANRDISLDAAGTGLARMLHVITCVLVYDPGRIFLIDEPTTHLHPGSEKLLGAFLRKHSEHGYVVCTHSPIIISALQPDRVWLVIRDERGSVIQPAFTEQARRRHVFQELGLSPGDIALAERLLFVEGLTDRLVYPEILRRLGWDSVAYNYEVIDLQGAEVAYPLEQAIDHLASVINIRYLIYLDGDKSGKLRGKLVKFLPVPEIEDLFLRDPAAVFHGFEEIIEQEHPEMLTEWKAKWTVDRVATYISERQNNCKGKRTLSSLAQEMRLAYRPTVYGPAIARAMDVSHLNDLRADFKDLFDDTSK